MAARESHRLDYCLKCIFFMLALGLQLHLFTLEQTTLKHPQPLLNNVTYIMTTESPIVLFSPPEIRDKSLLEMVRRTNKSISPALKSEPFVRALVVTSWRSGSTLTGELLNAYPGSFYTYEPLSFAGIDRIYEGSPEATAVKRVIKGLLTCNHSLVINEYMRHGQKYTSIAGGELITRNNLLRGFCKVPLQRLSTCSNPAFLDNMCALSNFHILKTVRLGLNLAVSLWNDQDLKAGLKIAYIARDPRGLINSRLKRDWCIKVPRCIHPKAICQDLVNDYWTVQRVLNQNRDRILIIRYEDLALNIWNSSRAILNFFGRDLQKEVKAFLVDHTQKEKFSAKPQLWNTFRDPKDAPVHWQKDLPYRRVVDIQRHCKTAMQLWGYRIFHNETELKSLSPLLPLNLWQKNQQSNE